MNEFLRKGIEEYKNRVAASQRFKVDCARIQELLDDHGQADPAFFTLLLTPLIEIAWIDGRVGRYEQDAILSAADKYGLLADDVNFLTIMERLTTRPARAEIEKWWKELASRFKSVSLPTTAALSSHLLEQTRYVAGLGQKTVFGLWRGHSAGSDEYDAVLQARQRLLEIESSIASEASDGEQDHLKLIPLVSVAWADGRITKRERRLIFDSFFDLGVRPTNENIQRLLSWLKLGPKDDLVQTSLQKLRQKFESLSPDERAKEKYSLISQCTLIAEASGGTSEFPGGGNRICDEEILAVKKIAAILNGALDPRKAAKDNGGAK